MEEKQSEIVQKKQIQELKPIGETKRPLLLSIIIIFWIALSILSSVSGIYVFFKRTGLNWKSFNLDNGVMLCNLSEVFISVLFSLFSIFIYVLLWKGNRQARKVIIVLGTVYIVVLFIGLVTEFSISSAGFFMANALILSYLIFNKNVQSYCNI